MAKKTGVELEFSILDEEFKKSIKEMNTSLSSMRKELTLENETLKSSSASVSDYENKLNTLREQQELSKNKVNEAASAYEKVKALFGENSKEASKYKDTLVLAQTEQQRITNDIDKTTSALNEYEAQLKESEQKNRDANTTLSTLNKTISEQKSYLDELKRQYVNTVLEQGKSSTQAKNLKNEIKNLSSEINSGEKRLNSAEQALDKFTDSQKDAGNQSITFGDLIKSNLISEAVIGGIKSLANSVKSMASDLVGFVKSGVESATDLAESQNVVDVTFKENSKTIDEWSKKAANAYGMSELSAKKFNGTMGAMLSSMGLSDDAVLNMSTDMVGLAGDMASFYNLDHEEAFNKIRAGISGETEPLKQLGINMSVANLEAFALSQGIDKSYNSMTQAEQATLRYNYLMEATKDAQGDFARTSDGLANQQRILTLNIQNLATEIGTNLLPTINGITTAINGMMSGEMSVDEGMAQITEVLMSLIDNIMLALPSFLEQGANILTSLLSGIISMIPQITPTLVQIITKIVTELINMLPQILQAGIQIIISLCQGIAQSLPTLVPTIVSVILEMVNILTNPDNLMNIINAALTLISSLAEGIIAAIPVLVEKLPEIINNITTFFTENLDQIIDTGVELIVNLAMALVDAIPVILENLPKILTAIVNGLLKILPKLATAGLQMIVKLGAALVENIPKLVAKIPQIITSIINGFGNLLSGAADIGKNFVTGLWNGINNAKDWILGKIKGFKDSVLNGIKSFFGIHSPSTLFRDEVGKNLALGLGLGFTNEMKSITDDMQDSIPTSFDVGINANSLNNAYSDNFVSNSRSVNDSSDYNPGQVAPIYLNIENFNNNREQDIEDLSEELEFYRMKVSYGKGNA